LIIIKTEQLSATHEALSTEYHCINDGLTLTIKQEGDLFLEVQNVVRLILSATHQAVGAINFNSYDTAIIKCTK